MERWHRGEPASRRLILYACDILEFANRTNNWRGNMAINNALTRLRDA